MSKHLGAVAAMWLCVVAWADTPSHDAFTYQGQLKHNGDPVIGPVNFAFRLYDAEVGGDQVGPEIESFGFDGFDDEGRFTLDLAFGKGVFDGTQLWLEVRVNGAPLSPRQPIMPTPYSIRALNVAAVADPALTGTYTSALEFTNPGNLFIGSFGGSFSGSGAALTNLNAGNITTGTIGSALLSGTYGNALTLNNAANVLAGDGFALTNLNAANLTGVLPNAALSGTYTNALTFSNAGNSFTGSGAGLTNLNASNITSGTLDEARLPASVLDRLPDFGVVPALVGSGGTGSQLTGLAVSGSYAYFVGWSPAQLQVIDISDPSSPSVVGSIPTASNPSAVAVSNGFAYVTHSFGNTLHVFDVTNPANPSFVTSVATHSGPIDITLSGNLAYVVNQVASTLQIFDVSNPASPAVLGSASTGATPAAVALSGNFAFVACKFSLELQIFNVSSPASPALVGVAATIGMPNSVDVANGYAYVVTEDGSGMQVFDVSNPASPSSVGSVSTAGLPVAVKVWNNHAYVLNTFGQSLQVFDVGDPASPSLFMSVPAPTLPTRLVLAGNHAFVLAHELLVFSRLGLAFNSGITAAGFHGDFHGDFIGSGAGLTSLNASHLTSGTLLNGRLGGMYSNALNFTNASNSFAGSFTGSGAGLTSLNASNLASGTVPNARLSGTYSNALTLSNASNSFNGSHSGSGAGLTALNASNITTGNLSAARMPTGGSWSLSSNLNILGSSSVGIGTTVPLSPLHVQGVDKWNWSSGNGWGDFSISNGTFGLAIGTALGGGGAGHVRLWPKGGVQRLTIGTPDAGDVLSVFNSGSVGIGTGSPGAFMFAVNGTAAKPGGGSWSSFSDARLKHNIELLEPGTLDQLLALRGYTFEYEDHAIEHRLALPGKQVGLIAQEVQSIFPDWVEADEEGYLYITERGTTAIFVEALRELRAEKDAAVASQQIQIDTLRTELAELRTQHVRETNAEIAALHERIDRLEALLAATLGLKK